MRIFSNTGALFAASALSRVMRVAVTIVLARHLGLELYGVLAFIVAYVEIFRIVSDFGIDTVLVRRLSMDGEAPEWIGSAAVLKIFSAFAAYGLGMGAAMVVGYAPDRLVLMGMGLTGLFLSSGANLCAVPFHANLRVHRIAWTGMVSTGIYFSLMVWGGGTGQGVPYFVVAGIIAELCGFALSLAVLLRHARVRWGGWEKIWRLFRQAFPVGLTTVIVIGYGRVGMLLLDRARGSDSVGIYAIALRLVEVLTLLAGALAGSAYPAMARLLEQRQRTALAGMYESLYGYAVAGATSATLLLMAFGPDLLRLVGLGSETASRTLTVLAWSAVFVFANQLSAALLLAAGLGSAVLGVAVWNLGVNIALSLWMIPWLGPVGVALALLITEATNMIVQSLLVWKRFGFIPALGLWFRASAACGIAVGSLSARAPVLTLLVLAIYLVTVLRRSGLSVRSIQRVLKIGEGVHGRAEDTA